MTLGQVLSGVKLRDGLSPDITGRNVAGLEYDSRRVGKDFLFFAFAGSRVDGRRFAQEAVTRGALAVVSELPPPPDVASAWIQVEHGRQALAMASRNFYQRPDERVLFAGITGTNGKTTTSYLVDAILRAAGWVTGLIGTIEYRLAGERLPAANTTPESLDVMRMAAELERRGAGKQALIMEVSSHALALGRAYGFRFHTAVFTNLTRDHLDFHETMENYFAAKHVLFESNGGRPPLFAVINRDDEYGKRIKPAAETETWWYGLGPDTNLRARHIDSSFRGLKFDILAGKQRIDIHSPLIGKINVYNILAAAG